MPPEARRRSWTVSSQRRSRLNAKGGGTTNNAVDGINCIDVSQYAKQLNPYKQHSSSLRGSTGSAVQYQTTRGVSNDDDLGLNVDDDDLDLGDDDDDDMRLENILSSIVDDSKSDAKMPSLDSVGKMGVIDEDSSKCNRRTAAEAPPSVAVVESDNFHSKISTSSVDFGGEISHPREMPPIHNTNTSIHEIGNISPVSDEDNDTNWSDGDATKLHKMMAQIDQVPAFASGGFVDATKLESISRMNGLTFRQIGVNNSGGGGGGGGSLLSSSLVDSIIDDIDMSYGNNGSDIFISGPESDINLNPLANSTSNALTPPRGRFSFSCNDRRRAPTSKTKLTNPGYTAHSKPHDDAPQSNAITSKTSERKLASSSRFTPQTHLLSGEIVHHKTEDETLSTVTDPTESPFIYAYKKSNDDDSVSQITSSLAGTSLGSSHLFQNIPNSTGVRIHTSGLSWMASNDGLITRGVGGDGGSRLMNRKGGMIISGPYGRGRDRKFPKAPGGNGYGRRNNKSSSSSGGGSAGSDSYDGGKKKLDEIAYALNADCSSGRNQRAMVTRRPPGRVGDARLASGGDDLSTVVSRNSRDDTQGDHQSSSYAYVDANINTNVSRLGMGGVSCAAQSVYSEGTADSTSTLGFFQRLALIVWKAQHHAGRFFFPTSLAVKRRKKFDQSDSMSDLEDILLEEGSKTMSHRQQSGSRGGHYDDDDDDIDYFSRAMSVSNNHNGSGGLRKSKDTRYLSQSKAARMACLIFVLVITFTIYRMPKKKGNDYYDILPNKGGFNAGKEDRFYDSIHHVNGQVLDYATDAMVDSDAYHRGRAGIADADRLGQETAGLGQEQNHPVQDDVQLPPVFEVLANVNDLLFQRGIDVPFYWHVPRSGGGTMNDVLGSCFHLTLAADAGGSEGHGVQETLEVIHLSRQVSYVNVDTSTHQGIARAKSLNLASSGLADVVISPHLHEASTLFTPTRRGRMFTMFRHPVERAASLFYFLQETQWRQPATRSDQFADVSIEKFYKGGFAENNWMTRFLTNNFGELTENDLSIAKKVLRQKCLVGLLEEKVETFNRMQHYFGWDPKSDEEKKCLKKKLDWSWPMKHKHPKIEKDSKAWTLIVAANSFDLKLYGYAKELFYLQGQQLFSQ